MSVLRHTIVVGLISLVCVLSTSRFGLETTASVGGALLAAVNATLAHGLNRWAMGRSDRTFFNVVLGGMAARLLVVPALAALAIAAFDLDPRAFVVTFVSLLVVFLAVEMTILVRSTAHRAIA